MNRQLFSALRFVLLVSLLLGAQLALCQSDSLPRLMVPKGHSKEATEMTLFNGGANLITASSDGLIKLWDLKQQKLLRNFVGHKGKVADLSISSDGKFMVSGGATDGTLRIWEIGTGKTRAVHKKAIARVSFNPAKPETFISINDDNSISRWTVTTGEMKKIVVKEVDVLESIDFDASGDSFAAGGDMSEITIYDSESLRSISSLKTRFVSRAIVLDKKNGRLVAGGPVPYGGKKILLEDGKTESRMGFSVWNLKSKARVDIETNFVVLDLQTNASGTTLLVNGFNPWQGQKGEHVRMYDLESLKQKARIDEEAAGVARADFLNDTTIVYTVENSVVKYEINTKAKKFPIATENRFIRRAEFQRKSNQFYVLNGDRLSIHQPATNTQRQIGKGRYLVDEFKQSSDGSLLACRKGNDLDLYYVNKDSTHLFLGGNFLYGFDDFAFHDNRNIIAWSDTQYSIWNVSTKAVTHTFKWNTQYASSLNGFSLASLRTISDNTLLLCGSVGDKTVVKLFDINTKKVLSEFAAQSDAGMDAVYNNRGDQVAAVSESGAINIWEAPSGKLIATLPSVVNDQYQNSLYQVDFSKDDKQIIFGNSLSTEVWDVAEKKLVTKHSFDDPQVSASAEGAWILSASQAKLKLLQLDYTPVVELWPMGSESELVVVSPGGLFDASTNSTDGLYFVQGVEVIEFNQLKERYYEPGLLKKVIAGEKLRDVTRLKSIELPPEIRVGKIDAAGVLPVELINKGGGIGEVNVFINGKEVISDARPKDADAKASSLSLKIFIGNQKNVVKGYENLIALKAWNAGHWVVSRGEVVTYTEPSSQNAYKPSIHIIACGVSDYTGTEIDLKYAAKDAEDVSKALKLGAKKLFGVEKSYVYNLTTLQGADQQPTKGTILKTFEKISATAHPLDIVVVYLSGHGINYGGAEGDWYYLTKDAYTASATAYGDPGIRQSTTISSVELVEWFKKIPSLKQVLMIDACASGRVVENLMAQKDISSSTIKALDRMRDRTGMHIITGCTADAVSYEASQYGQGVLTYSLLEGIRGAALREDQFVDVNKLFQYAHDRVPQLAEGIGGIQSPQVFSPQGSQSFDIGQLDAASKNEIPIAKIRPVYIRSTFLDVDQLEDALQLGKKIDEALNEASAKGTAGHVIFVDVREYPEGCKLSGKYSRDKGVIKLTLRKKCEGKDTTHEIVGKTVEEVVGKVLRTVF